MICRAGLALAAALALASPALAGPDWSLPPRLAPRGVDTVVPVVRAAPGHIASAGAPARSLPPRLRPGSPARTTTATAPRLADPVAEAVPTGRRGQLCGDRQIEGQTLRSIPGRLPGCGVTRPVRVERIAGIRLEPAATLSCDTARALRSWMTDSANPAWGRLGGGLSSVSVAASYDCRPRNGQAGAPISEHGRGAAIDISGFTLKNGKRISVEGGWRDPLAGRILRQIHKDACRRFTTVLGPDADVYHRDHLHLDTGRGRGVCQ